APSCPFDCRCDHNRASLNSQQKVQGEQPDEKSTEIQTSVKQHVWISVIRRVNSRLLRYLRCLFFRKAEENKANEEVAPGNSICPTAIVSSASFLSSETRPSDKFSAAAPQRIPDHELLRCIGSGSYGEVWLARNIMGTYRAVKVTYR